MEAKKTPKADLERKRGIFFQAGLVLVLILMIAVFEHKTYAVKESTLVGRQVKQEVEEIVLNTQEDDVPPPPPDEAPPPEGGDIDIKDDDEELVRAVDLTSFTRTTNVAPVVLPPAAIKDEEIEDEEEIFIVVEKEAGFPGGEEKLMSFLRENVKYPQAAKETGTSGVVWVTFVIEKDGSITDVKVLRDIGGGCGSEAVRVVKLMPKWTSASQRGKPVRQQFRLPISFILK